MKDISASITAAAVTLPAGTVLGLDMAALLAGFAGGIVALSLMRSLDSWVARLGSLMAATLCGAFLGPWASHLVHMDGLPHTTEVHAVAFVIGAGAQVLLPILIEAISNRIRQAGGIQQ